MADLTKKSLTEIVSLIKKKEIKSEEVTNLFIKNIENDKKLNSFITNCNEHAVKKAKNFDENPKLDTLLPGIPIAVKDLFCTNGVKTTAGSKMLENFVPNYESTITKNLWNEGAFLLGKLNCDEYAMGSSNETSYFGNVMNPVAENTVPGGSSGGSASALAAVTYNNGNGTLTADANGALSVDGAAVVADDRILVKDQASAVQNGIYKVTATGGAGAAFVLTRTPDADTAAELTGGTFFFVEEGTANADNGYVATHNGTPTFGSTNITFVQFSGAGQISAGDALTKSGNTLNVAVDDSSIEVNSDALRVKASGITNAMLAGSIAISKLSGAQISFSDDSSTVSNIALGETIAIAGGEGVDATISGQTLTIAGEDATASNKGVASFSSDNFTVSSGAVTVTTIDGGSF